MDQEAESSDLNRDPAIIVKAVKFALLVLVWLPFLGSNYLTIRHLVFWAKTDNWPNYSTANLFSDLSIGQPKGAPLAIQPAIEWLMSAPAAYSLMATAIVLSVTLALLPDG